MQAGRQVKIWRAKNKDGPDTLYAEDDEDFIYYCVRNEGEHNPVTGRPFECDWAPDTAHKTLQRRVREMHKAVIDPERPHFTYRHGLKIQPPAPTVPAEAPVSTVSNEAASEFLTQLRGLTVTVSELSTQVSNNTEASKANREANEATAKSAKANAESIEALSSQVKEHSRALIEISEAIGKLKVQYGDVSVQIKRQGALINVNETNIKDLAYVLTKVVTDVGTPVATLPSGRQSLAGSFNFETPDGKAKSDKEAGSPVSPVMPIKFCPTKGLVLTDSPPGANASSTASITYATPFFSKDTVVLGMPIGHFSYWDMSGPISEVLENGDGDSFYIVPTSSEMIMAVEGSKIAKSDLVQTLGLHRPENCYLPTAAVIQCDFHPTIHGCLEYENDEGRQVKEIKHFEELGLRWSYPKSINGKTIYVLEHSEERNEDVMKTLRILMNAPDKVYNAEPEDVESVSVLLGDKEYVFFEGSIEEDLEDQKVDPSQWDSVKELVQAAFVFETKHNETNVSDRKDAMSTLIKELAENNQVSEATVFQGLNQIKIVKVYPTNFDYAEYGMIKTRTCGNIECLYADGGYLPKDGPKDPFAGWGSKKN